MFLFVHSSVFNFFNKLSAHLIPRILADLIGPIFLSSTKFLKSFEYKRAFNRIEVFSILANAPIGVKQSHLFLSNFVPHLDIS